MNPVLEWEFAEVLIYAGEKRQIKASKYALNFSSREDDAELAFFSCVLDGQMKC